MNSVSTISPDAPGRLALLVRGVADGSYQFPDLIQALLPLISGKKKLPHATALELATALIEIERTAAQNDQLIALVNEHGAAALALSDSGQILAMNSMAVELFRISTGDGLSALGISREEFAGFTNRLTQHSDSTLVKAYISPAGQKKPSVLMSVVYYPGYHAFVLTLLQQHWPQSTDDALAELYHLTRSELEILRLLSQGVTSDAIAELRSRTPGTVRQQIKSILQKMSLPNQLSAATLVAAAAATVSTATRGHSIGDPSGYLPLQQRDAPLTSSSFIRDKRRIGWRQFGDPEGAPVLYLHGPSFGAGEYIADRRLANRHQLNVYALERPGYARTDPPQAHETILQCCTNDAAALLDQLNIDRVTLLSHEVALIPALELARQFPKRVQGILSVSSAPPFLQLEHIRAIPENQGIFIQAARHEPWLAHLLIRLLLVQIRQLGPQEWSSVIFADLQPDSRVMQRPELLPGIIGTYSFYLNQRGAGFEQDLQLMLLDWCHLVSETQIPLHLLHGTENPTTPVSHLNIFHSHRPDIRISTVPEAGLTLAVSHPHLVYQHLSSLANAG